MFLQLVEDEKSLPSAASYRPFDALRINSSRYPEFSEIPGFRVAPGLPGMTNPLMNFSDANANLYHQRLR
jgi:hypothetical protein